MRGPRGRLPLGFGGAAFFGFSGMGALVGAAWMVLYPPVPRDLGGAPDLDARARHVRIAVAHGDSIDAWYLPPRNGAVVLLLHGYGRSHARMWRYAAFLTEAGYGVLAPDFRSSRAHRRLPTTLGVWEVPDAEAALGWLRRETKDARIGLLGESLGGSVGLVTAARHPEIRAVVADGPFASGRLAIEESCERWLHVPRRPLADLLRGMARATTGHDPMALDVVAAATRLRDRPTWFIACENDNRFSPAQIELLARAAGSREPLWRIPRAGHNEGWKRERAAYETRVLEFFGRHLGRPA